MKVTKKNRLKRFGKWSDEHQQSILDRVNVSEGDFDNYSRARKRRVLNRALAHAKGDADTPTPTVGADPLKDAVDSAVRLKYQPAERQYNQQVADSTQMDTNIDAWYQDYLNTLSGVQKQSQDFYGAVAGQQQPVPTAVPGDEASMAAANRATLANSVTKVIAGQGANMNALYGGQMADSKLAKIGYHQDEDKERKTIKQQLADLALEKGDYANSYRQDLLDKAHQSQLEDAAFNLDKDKLAVSAGYDPYTGKPIPQTPDVVTSGPFAGYSKDEIAGMSAGEKARLKKKSKSPDSTITSGAFAGYTQGDLRKMTPKQKSALVNEFKRTGGKKTSKDKSDKYRANDNAWTTGLAALREDHSLTMNDLIAPPGAAGGYGIPADIAEALIYWANPKHPKKGGHLTPELKRRLKKLHVHFRDDGYKGIG